ncbi:MAG: hypothetical protein WBJ13_07190 [Sedimentibacter sp.]
MGSFYSLIYVDDTNSIWKFSQNDNKELNYKIMYEEGKWTKEILIEKNVLGFSFYAEEDGKIHMIYSNTKGEIKYCTFKDKQWMGKTIYKMESKEYEIHNLKVDIMDNEMHIFYLLIENNGRDHGMLMHCIWNGKETKITKLQDIILISNITENYIVKVDKKNNIDVLFISDEGDEVSLNYCCYQNRRWTTAERLYGIQGDDIAFDMLKKQQDMHILNKYEEGSIYYLNHVHINMSGNIQEYKVRESIIKLTEPLLFKVNNKLYSCWLEENKIFYSDFDGKDWSSPTCFNKGNEHKVERYHFYTASDKETAIEERDVYGTTELDLDLLFPSQFVIEERRILKSEENLVEEVQGDVNQVYALQKEQALQNFKLGLSKVKSENKDLENTIASLNMQLKTKQNILDEYEERITRISEQKQKADENCNIFMELQQKMQKELEYLNQQLLEERNLKINSENKLKEYEEENTNIRQQLEIITEANTKLNKELELEKNQSVMERFLKRKANEV